MTNSTESLRQAATKELAKRELARRHLLPFIHYTFKNYEENWHHKVICEYLEAVERGDIKRLMFFLPPRSGKSEIGANHFPAWCLGRNPKQDIITASYASDLATDFGRKVRNLVASDEYQNVFKTKLSEDNASAGKWTTDQGGEYVAAGVGGGITGKGAGVLIIDDPVKNREEAESPTIQKRNYDWYRSTAYTRLSPDGAIVLITTRWHDSDLAGMILANDSDSWTIISFPAIAEHDEDFRKTGEALWPSRWPLEKLLEIKKALGSYEWSALYQQNPLDNETQEFKRSMFRYRTWSEVESLQTRRYLTVDTAMSKGASSDYTGIVRNYVDRENKWNVRAFRTKVSPLELIEMLFTLHEQDHYDKIGIEETVYLDAIKPFIDQEQRLRNRFLPIVPLKHNQTAKELRIRGLLPRYESASIYHITGECADLEEEELRFPKGAHDDVVDSMAYQIQLAEPPKKERDNSLPAPRPYFRRNFQTTH